MFGSETAPGEMARNICTLRRLLMNHAQHAKFRVRKSFVRQSLVLVTLAITLTGAAIPASAETPTDIYNFKGGTGDVSGALPYGLIAQGRDGNFYGEAPAGGANGDGGIFMVTPSGPET